MNEIETVRIAQPHAEGDYIVINQADFDPAIHTLYAEPKADKKAAKKAEDHAPDAA